MHKTTFRVVDIGAGCAIIKTYPDGTARPMFAGYGQSRGRNQQRLANIARWRQDEGQVVDLREGELIVLDHGAEYNLTLSGLNAIIRGLRTEEPESQTGASSEDAEEITPRDSSVWDEAFDLVEWLDLRYRLDNIDGIRLDLKLACKEATGSEELPLRNDILILDEDAAVDFADELRRIAERHGLEDLT